MRRGAVSSEPEFDFDLLPARPGAGLKGLGSAADDWVGAARTHEAAARSRGTGPHNICDGAVRCGWGEGSGGSPGRGGSV